MGSAVAFRGRAGLDAVLVDDSDDDLVAASRTLAAACTRLAEVDGPAAARYVHLADRLARLTEIRRPDRAAILAASPRFEAASYGPPTAVEALAGWAGSEAERVLLAVLLLRACIWRMPDEPAEARDAGR